MQIELIPLANEHLPVLEEWFADPETRIRKGGMLPLQDWMKHTQSNNHLTTWIARENKEYVGLVTLEKEHTQGWIGLIVNPRLRGKGYAGLILKMIEEKARSMDVNALKIEIENDHHVSKKTFEKAGFIKSTEESSSKEFTVFRKEI